ncbi:MAG: hypothetical protein ACRCW9_03930 [Cetobacterium sp.]
MGIQFETKTLECGVRWSYGGFGKLRREIAFFFDINLNKMNGFNEENDYKGISWKSVKNPIKYFLDHYDNMGNIHPYRLKLIVPELKKYNVVHKDLRLNELINFMELCIRKNERLVFC